MPFVPTGSPCTVPKASSSGGGSVHREYPCLRILHQDQPAFHLEQLIQLWVLNPHSLHLDFSLLCLHLLWHLAGPPAGGLFQALLHLPIVAWMLGILSLA